MDTLLFHPKLVHLPIALALLMPFVTGGLLLAWWRRWLPPRTWLIAVVLQAALLGSGALAMQTGEVDEERVEQVVPERFIEVHEEAAEAFVWASGAVFGVMLLGLVLARSRAGLPVAAAAALGTVVILGLGYRTGQAGGDLVYRHGAADAFVEPGGARPPVAGRRYVEYEHDDD